MKIKNIIIIILLMNAGISLSKSIHKLSINTVGTINYWSNTDILNGQLFFQDSFTEYLWVSDGTNNGSHILEYNQQPIQLNLHRKTLIAYKNSIYFINKSDGNTLWKTDGELFEQVSSNSFSASKGLKIYSNHLIGSLSDESLVLINENGINNLNLENLNKNTLDSLCVIGQNNYIIYSHFDNSPSHLYQIKNGEVLSLDENIANNGSFSLSATNNNSCFYKYKNENNLQSSASSFIAVAESGLVTKIETEIDGEATNTWQNIIEFKDSIYFYPERKNGNYNDMFLYKYENQTVSIIQDIVLNHYVSDVFSSNNFLYVLYQTPAILDPVPPGYVFYQFYVFDINFNNIFHYDANDHYRKQFLSPSSNEDIIVFNQDISSLGFINNSNIKELNIPNLKLNSILADSKNTYIYGTDRNNSNASSIYVIKDSAVISQNLDGLWHAPEYQYQGLTIHTGEHIDGSQYLVASYRFFENGVPFWIAGSTTLNLTPTLTFNMYEYTGTSPYIPNNIGQNSQRIKYGEITLQAISCDRLNLNLTFSNDTNFNLDLERIGRSGRTITCID